VEDMDEELRQAVVLSLQSDAGQRAKKDLIDQLQVCSSVGLAHGMRVWAARVRGGRGGAARVVWRGEAASAGRWCRAAACGGAARMRARVAVAARRL